MSTSVAALTLDGFDKLPAHSRRCLFWEAEPGVAKDADDPVFEKEAWLSMVMLEWGSCGQVVVADGRPAGAAIYSPPVSVPRAKLFPTAPVSADAVLLTSLWLERGRSGCVQSASGADGELSRQLVQAVVADLVRRGVRALEAFGFRHDGEASDAGTDPEVPVATAARECSPALCMIGADFLEDVGFEVVAPHHRFPRFRLELDHDHGWKEDVEYALDQLLAAAAAERTMVGAGSSR